MALKILTIYLFDNFRKRMVTYIIGGFRKSFTSLTLGVFEKKVSDMTLIHRRMLPLDLELILSLFQLEHIKF